MSKKESKIHSEKDDGLPLLESFQNLLEKEKLVLNLQVLKEKQQAAEWKAKYDSLVGKMVNTAAYTQDMGMIETVAVDEEELIKSGIMIQDSAQKDILDQIKNHKMINLSSTSETKNVLTESKLNKISKDIIVSKGNKNPTYLFFKNTLLNDSHVKALIPLLKIPSVDAIDLSYNNLGIEMESQLIELLKGKRKTPQYILFNGNMDASLSPHFIDVVHLLTDRTWGISVTLQDLAPAMDKKKSKKKGTTKDLDFIGTADRSMSCEAFLKELNMHFDVNPIVATNKKVAVSKTKIPLKAKGGTGSGRVRPGDRRDGGLQMMSVFGLTDAELSVESKKHLSKTLDLTRASLTDLDLTRCYLGGRGANIVKEALEREGCNLIRVCLKGNAIGDVGAILVASALSKNNTLTHLDVSSNDICFGGLEALCDAAIKSKVLHTLDISRNDCDRASVAYLEERLRSRGSNVHLEWRSFKSYTGKLIKINNATDSSVIYSSSSIIKKHLSIRNNAVCLCKINGEFLPKSASSSDHAQVIRWFMRLSVPSNLVGSAGVMNTGIKKIPPKILYASQVQWQIRVVNDEEASENYSVLDRGLIDDRCNVPYYSMGEDVRAGNWIEYSAFVDYFPKKAWIELWATTLSDSNAKSGRVDVELHSFKIESRNIGDRIIVSCDNTEFTPNMFAACTKASIDNDPLKSLITSALSDEYSLLRLFVWNHPTNTTVQFKFDMKLVSQKMLETEESSRIAGGSPFIKPAEKLKDSNIGYKWKVLVIHSAGFCDVIEEDVCETVTIDEDTTTKSLSPWLWRSWSINIPEILPNDRIILTATPTNAGRNNSTLCTLLAKNCSLNVAIERPILDKRVPGDSATYIIGDIEPATMIFDSSNVHLDI